MSYVFRPVLSMNQLFPKNELCLSSCLSLSVRLCVRTCQRRPCMTFFTTLNTEGNGTQTSSRPSISGNLRSMRMLVTTHVCCTLMCKHVHSFVTNMICEGKRRRTWSARWPALFCSLDLSCTLTGSCPKPLRNRDVITLRSWLPIGKDYIIMNYSVKHAVSVYTHTHAPTSGLHMLSWGPLFIHP